MKKYNQAWFFNEQNINRVLNGFKVERENGRAKIYIGDECISDIENTDKSLFFQTIGFKNLMLKHIKDYGIKPRMLGFTLEDGHYEFKFIGKTINVLGHNFSEYLTLTDSMDGSLALQLNFGLFNEETNAIAIVDYNNPSASNRWRHGKVTFQTRTANIQEALKSFNHSIERTIKTLDRLQDKKISYRRVIEGLTEYDNNGNIKLGQRQKLLAINRKMRKEYGIKDDNIIEALKTPEGFLKSGLDFNVCALTLFLFYIDAYKEQNSSAITRENNRILEIIFKVFEDNSLKNKNEVMFQEKTGMTFTKFYNNHFSKLSWFLSKYTRTIESAEDFANEAFVQGLNKIELYNPEKSKVHTWIYRIGENLVRKHHKDEQKLPVVSFDNTQKDDLNLLNMLSDKDGGSENALTIIEKKAEIVRQVIYNLPPKYEKYKLVLIMREFDNMHYQEISDKTGINISTVKSQISKGRKIVVKKVEKQFALLDKELMGD